MKKTSEEDQKLQEELNVVNLKNRAQTTEITSLKEKLAEFQQREEVLRREMEEQEEGNFNLLDHHTT